MQIETLDREAVAKLISDQAAQIERLTGLLFELRVGGAFKNPRKSTREALEAVDELVGERR